MNKTVQWLKLFNGSPSKALPPKPKSSLADACVSPNKGAIN